MRLAAHPEAWSDVSGDQEIGSTACTSGNFTPRSFLRSTLTLEHHLVPGISHQVAGKCLKKSLEAFQVLCANIPQSKTTSPKIVNMGFND